MRRTLTFLILLAGLLLFTCGVGNQSETPTAAPASVVERTESDLAAISAQEASPTPPPPLPSGTPLPAAPTPAPPVPTVDPGEVSNDSVSMDALTIGLLTGFGVPTIVIIVLLGFWTILKGSISTVMERAVREEAAKTAAAYQQKLEEKKHELGQELENKKHELGQETERLKVQLSVEAETHRLAAKEKFTALMALWQASESLLRDTKQSDDAALTTAMKKVVESMEDIQANAVLYSPALLLHLQRYLRALERTFKEAKDKIEAPEDVAESVSDSSDDSPEPRELTSWIFRIRHMLGGHISKPDAESARESLKLILLKEFGVLPE